MIAGTGSGVGKTTVALGLMASLCKKHKVQPFKVGPDFIDTGHHTHVCGRPSMNHLTAGLSGSRLRTIQSGRYLRIKFPYSFAGLA